MILKSHLGSEFKIIIDQLFFQFSIVVHLDPTEEDARYIHL